MSRQSDEQQRAWVQARVDEAGSVQRATPEGFTERAWIELCRHLGVTGRPKKARTLEEALERLAELAG